MQFLRLLRFGRLARLVRYVRLARPLIRLGRILIFALRFTDRLVRRYASLLNQNIVFFEDDGDEATETRPGHQLTSLRRLYNQRVGVVLAGLDTASRLELAGGVLADLEAVPDAPDTASRVEPIPDDDRTIPVESVVEHLIEITPEQLLEEHGPAFVESVDRYLRLFDAPLVRRLPMIREVVAYRENGPAESVALAANCAGPRDARRSQRDQLRGRPAGDDLAPAVPRPAGGGDRASDPAARQAIAQPGLGVPGVVPGRQQHRAF